MNTLQIYALAEQPLQPNDTRHTIALRIWSAIEADCPGLHIDRSRQRTRTYQLAALRLRQVHSIPINNDTVTDPTTDDHRPVPVASDLGFEVILLVLFVLGLLLLGLMFSQLSVGTFTATPTEGEQPAVRKEYSLIPAPPTIETDQDHQQPAPGVQSASVATARRDTHTRPH